MIKKLFITQSIFFYIVSSSQVLTYVGNTASVTIQPQTLLYNGGGLETAGTSVVDNYGNIMIKGVNTGATTDDLVAIGTSSKLNLKFVNGSSYGQFYITGIKQGKISGLVNKEYQPDYIAGTTGSQQLGLPFYNFTVGQLESSVGAGNLNLTNTTNNSSGRFAPNSAFWWNNAKARFDQIAYNGTAYSSGTPNASFISPMTYYILPRKKSATAYYWNSGDTKIFSGVPASDVIETSSVNNVKFALTGAYAGSFGTNGNASNYFGEKYYSYVDDPFASRTDWTGTNFGRNLYQLANPFLTNVDLWNIARDSETGSDGNYIDNLTGVAYYGASNITWTSGSGTQYDNTKVIKFTFSGGIPQGGDVNTSMIKPMGAFMVKLGTNASNKFLDFTNIRRFKQTSRTSGSDNSVTANKLSTSEGNDIPADKIVKQVAVVMYDLDGMELDRTYYAVSPTAITGYNANATVLQAYAGDNKIYTKEEKPEGGEDSNYADKLYINEANEVTFKTKEIPLYVNYSGQPYQLKFELYEKGARVESGLSDGTSFYIKDSQNQIIKITDGEFLPMSGSQTLGLYYEKPSSATLGTDSFGKAGTIIAKKNDQWVVRFAKDWKNAKVEVYSVSGQLLNSRSNISTNTDYVLPISDQVKTTFVVKAVSESGDVVIKKIVN